VSTTRSWTSRNYFLSNRHYFKITYRIKNVFYIILSSNSLFPQNGKNHVKGIFKQTIKNIFQIYIDFCTIPKQILTHLPSWSTYFLIKQSNTKFEKILPNLISTALSFLKIAVQICITAYFD